MSLSWASCQKLWLEHGKMVWNCIKQWGINRKEITTLSHQLSLVPQWASLSATNCCFHLKSPHLWGQPPTWLWGRSWHRPARPSPPSSFPVSRPSHLLRRSGSAGKRRSVKAQGGWSCDSSTRSSPSSAWRWSLPQSGRWPVFRAGGAPRWPGSAPQGGRRASRSACTCRGGVIRHNGQQIFDKSWKMTPGTWSSPVRWQEVVKQQSESL